MIQITPQAPCKLGPVDAITLSNQHNMSVTILSLGCTIQRLCVPDVGGKQRDVCLGYDTPQDYLDHDGYFGAAIGRNGNRIANAQFALNGKTYNLTVNDGPNQLHGGLTGFDKKIWLYAIDEPKNRVVFSTGLADGEEGFPGNMEVKITYILGEDNSLRIDYEAVSDADTVANFTNHTYFNLTGHGSGDILNHELQLSADCYTPANEQTMPTGEIIPVNGTCMDFRKSKAIGRDLADPALANWNGYDHNFCLPGRGLRQVGRLYSPDSGIAMYIETTLEGIQLYTGCGLTHRVAKDGKVYERCGGLCLETQHYPDAPNQPTFPSSILRKGDVCQETTVYRFGVEGRA